MNISKTRVKDRLRLQLNDKDKSSIKKSVIKYVATTNPKEISKNFAYEVGCAILPELKKQNKDWIGISRNKLNQSHQAVDSFFLHIEEQLSIFCQLWHTAARIGLSEEICNEDSVSLGDFSQQAHQNQAEIESSQQPQRRKRKSGKRKANQRIDDEHPEELAKLIKSAKQKPVLQEKVSFKNSLKIQSKKASPSKITKIASFTPSLRKDFKAGILGSDGQIYRYVNLGLNSQ